MSPFDLARRLAFLRLRVHMRDARGLTRDLRVTLVTETRRGSSPRADAGLCLHYLDLPGRVTVFVPWSEATGQGRFGVVPTRALHERR